LRLPVLLYLQNEHDVFSQSVPLTLLEGS
jgi:hypothetical protein